MSSFREEAARMQAAYQEVQGNQEELDEGIGSLLRAGGRALKGVAGKATRSATKAATSPGAKAAVKNVAGKVAKPAAVAGAAVGADVYGTGGKVTRSLGRAARDVHDGVTDYGRNKLPEYGADNKKDDTKTDNKDDNKDDNKNNSSSSTDSNSSSNSSSSSSSSSSSGSSSTSSGGKSDDGAKAIGAAAAGGDKKKPTKMQQWAKAHPGLAKKVKPGQSGYKEIQSMKSEQMEDQQDPGLTKDLMNSLGDAYASMYDLEEQGGKNSGRNTSAAAQRTAAIEADRKRQAAGGGAAAEKAEYERLQKGNVKPTGTGQQRWRRASDDSLRRQAGYNVRQQGDKNLKSNPEFKAQPQTSAPTPAPKKEDPAPKKEDPAPRVDSSPAPRVDSSPAPRVDLSPAPRQSSSPAPRQSSSPAPAKGPSVYDKGPKQTSNPLMQKTFGYQKGNAPGQKAAAASSGARSIGSAVSPSPKPAAPKPDTSQVRAMSAPTAPKPSASPIKSPRLAAALNSVSKFKSENYDAMVRYMVGEGYAPNEEAAKAIVEHMSDDWVIDLMG